MPSFCRIWRDARLELRARALDGVHDVVPMLMCTQHTILKTVSRLTAAGEVSHCRTVCANRVPAVRPLCGEQSLHHGYHCTWCPGAGGSRKRRGEEFEANSRVVEIRGFQHSGALATRIDKHVATRMMTLAVWQDAPTSPTLPSSLPRSIALLPLLLPTAAIVTVLQPTLAHRVC